MNIFEELGPQLSGQRDLVIPLDKDASDRLYREFPGIREMANHSDPGFLVDLSKAQQAAKDAGLTLFTRQQGGRSEFCIQLA